MHIARICSPLALVAGLALLVFVTGCAKLPEGRTAIDDVAIRGSDAVADADITDQIATQPSPKLLGLFRGVIYDYELLDLYALQRDLARIERYYRARGYYDAHARAARQIPTSNGHVRVEIVVEEGVPIVVDDVTVTGTEGLPDDVATAATQAAKRKIKKKKPFDEDAFKEAEDDVKRALTERGYAWAKVTSDAWLDVVHHLAKLTFHVAPDRLAKFGKITITGIPAEIPEDQIRRTLEIEEGDPYSSKTVDDAAQALLDLNVFAGVDIQPELPEPPPDDRVVPLTIKVEPTRLRELRLGGGIELDQIKTDLHGLIGWRNRNFLGGLRDLAVDLRPGVVLYPLLINRIVSPERYLPEERFSVQLRQPGFVEARTTGFVRPELNTFPLLVKTNPSPDDPVIGYVESKTATGVDRSFGKLFVSTIYNAQLEFPFSYKDPFDAALRRLIISYPELITQVDLRDDRIHTKSGWYFGNDIQVSGGPFFGDVRDLKIQPEVRAYATVARRFTFASRATVGLLFPSNYGDVVRHDLIPSSKFGAQGGIPQPDPAADEERSVRTQDIEKVYFRGFFSGGSTSNRGFPIRGIAPHGVVPFLNPSTASQQIQIDCDPSNPGLDFAKCAIPIGGFTLWEFSNEVRIGIGKSLHAAIFCDMSDVSPEVANIRLDHLHLSCGLGARYDTLVGPIRVDLGYRIQPLQVLGYRSEVAARDADLREGEQPTFLGVPLALAIGIGEAF